MFVFISSPLCLTQIGWKWSKILRHIWQERSDWIYKHFRTNAEKTSFPKENWVCWRKKKQWQQCMDQIRGIFDKSPLHFVLWHGDLISFAVLMINTICYSRINLDTMLINCEGGWNDQINLTAQRSPCLHVAFLLFVFVDFRHNFRLCIFQNLEKHFALCRPRNQSGVSRTHEHTHQLHPLRAAFTLTNTDICNYEGLGLRLKHSEKKMSFRTFTIFSTSGC